MYQLQNSQNQALCVRGMKRNHIPIVYMKLKLINGRHLSPTYKGTQLLHIKKFSRIKSIVQN